MTKEVTNQFTWTVDDLEEILGEASLPTTESKGLIADRDGIRGKGDGPGSPDSGNTGAKSGGPKSTDNHSSKVPLSERGAAVLTKIEEKYPPVNPEGHDSLTRQQDEEGNFLPEREALHRSMVEGTLAQGTPVDNPEFVMFGGGSASGKSTAKGAGGIELPTNAVSIDADKFKEGLPEYNALIDAGDSDLAAGFVHEESSHLVKETMRRSLADGKNVILDGTGDSSYDSVVAKVQRARDMGHSVRAEYVTCKTESAIARARARGEKSNRKVIESVIRGNHKSVSQVVPQAIKEGLFDTLNLYDTEIKGNTVHVASAVGNKLTVHDPVLWERFLAKGNE